VIIDTLYVWPNDIVYFEMFIDEQLIDEYAGQRVKVFQMNGDMFVACEDGDDVDGKVIYYSAD